MAAPGNSFLSQRALNFMSALTKRPLDGAPPVPLKVTLVMDTRAWAGTESYVRTLALELRALNAEGEPGGEVLVSVAAPPASALWQRARAEALPTLAVARHHPWGLDTLQVLTRRLRRGGADVLHAHNGRTSLFGALAVRLARRGACVLTHHFISPAHAESGGLLGTLKSAAHHRLSEGIAHHIAISDAVAQAILARGEVPPARLSVVRNGIQTPPQNGEDSLPPQLRAPIACVARLQKEKDLPTLIKAMKILRDERPNAAESLRCVIAGEGAERLALETLIREQNLEETVILAGFTPLAGQILRAAQVCVLPSSAEPFGLALVEAMAQKRAVVAINAGGPREIVVEGETGFLVPPGDAPAMARALGAVLDDPQRAQLMGEAGFARFQSHFTAQRMAREILAVYQKAGETKSG